MISSQTDSCFGKKENNLEYFRFQTEYSNPPPPPQLTCFKLVRALQRNSSMTTKREKERPPKRTTKTPPTLSIFSGITVPEPFLLSSAHWPPPFFCFHQRSLSISKSPLSCSCRMACDSGTRYGESRKRKKCWFKHDLKLKLLFQILPLAVAIPYPFESSSPPICVRLHSLSMVYSMEADSMRKAYVPSRSSTAFRPSSFDFINTSSACLVMKFHITL